MNQDVEGVPKPFNNVVRLQWMVQHLRNFKPTQPAQMIEHLYMLEVAGDLVCANASYKLPTTASALDADNVRDNSLMRQADVEKWLRAPQTEPVLKKAGLIEMAIKGITTLVIGSCPTT